MIQEDEMDTFKPRKDNGLIYQKSVRFSENEGLRIDIVAEELETTPASVIRQATIWALARMKTE